MAALRIHTVKGAHMVFGPCETQANAGDIILAVRELQVSSPELESSEINGERIALPLAHILKQKREPLPLMSQMVVTQPPDLGDPRR